MPLKMIPTITLLIIAFGCCQCCCVVVELSSLKVLSVLSLKGFCACNDLKLV